MAASRAATRPDPNSPHDKAAEECLAFYNARLKGLLEPEYNGQFVAILADTHEYVVGPTSGEAMRAMRELHPGGQVLLHRIGPVSSDSGLAARMMGARVAARPQ